MPLHAYVADRLAALRAFLADPEAVALQICTRTETRLAAAKLLAAACNDDEEPAMLIGFTGTFTDPHSFCAALHETVAAEVEVALELLAGEQLAFRIPTPSEDPRVPVEVRLVEYLETVARAMHNHVARIVVALDVEAEDPQGWADTLARLMANTGSGRLVWVTFDDGPAYGAVAYHRHRTALRRADEELEHLLTAPGARMLTFIRQQNTVGPRHVLQRLRQRDSSGRGVWVCLEVPARPYSTPMQFYVEARRALAQQLRGGAHVGPLVADAEEPAAYMESEMEFADFCHRLALAALRPGVGMVVVIPPPTACASDFTASLHRLAQAATSTRVKFVTFDPLRVQPATRDARRVHRFEFDLGPQRMEAHIEAELGRPDLPPRDRLQLTMALAGLRLGQDRFEEAVALNVEALTLAEASPEPVDACVGWYQFGNVHYHLTFYDEAEQAYAEAAHRSLEAGQPGLAAMALTGAGHAYFCRGDVPAALQSYEAAIAVFGKLGLLQHEIFARTWAGQTLVMGRRWAEARAAFEDALRRCDAIDPLYADSVAGSRAEILHRMSHLYSLAGRSDLARKYRTEAEALGMPHAPCMHP
jgi:tetratricopeptide (TPR) repeat protein